MMVGLGPAVKGCALAYDLSISYVEVPRLPLLMRTTEGPDMQCKGGMKCARFTCCISDALSPIAVCHGRCGARVRGSAAGPGCCAGGPQLTPHGCGCGGVRSGSGGGGKVRLRVGDVPYDLCIVELSPVWVVVVRWCCCEMCTHGIHFLIRDCTHCCTLFYLALTAYVWCSHLM